MMQFNELVRRLNAMRDGKVNLNWDREVDQLIADTSQGVSPAGAGEFFRVSDPANIKAPAPAKVLPPENRFDWGPKSRAELKGVKPELVECAALALMHYSTQDFMCYDGIRTVEEQRHYVKIGTSQTMQSKHLPQLSDGFGHAVDLVPVVNGVPKWDWALIYEVARAVKAAADYLGIANHIRWGGAWDRVLSDFKSDAHFQQVVTDYTQRHPGKDFIDGPHFEWKD